MEKTYACDLTEGDKIKIWDASGAAGRRVLLAAYQHSRCASALLTPETARQLATDLHEWAGPVARYPEPAVEPEPMQYVLPPHPVWLATYREVLRAHLRNGATALIAIESARYAADESVK